MATVVTLVALETEVYDDDDADNVVVGCSVDSVELVEAAAAVKLAVVVFVVIDVDVSYAPASKTFERKTMERHGQRFLTAFLNNF